VHKTRLLLLRHAETSDPNRFHGAESDIGLGERGFLQAEAVAKVLAAENPDVLYSSAMKRALETAGPIGEACQLGIEILPELHERKMGPLSGLSRDEGLEEYGQAKDRWMTGDLDYTHLGGESYRQIHDRVMPLFKDVVSKSAGKTIVIVAHGVVIRVILTTILPGKSAADFDQFPIDNVAINDLRWDGSTWEAVVLNQRVGLEQDSFAW